MADGHAPTKRRSLGILYYVDRMRGGKGRLMSRSTRKAITEPLPIIRALELVSELNEATYLDPLLRDVWNLADQSWSDKQIAYQLDISEVQAAELRESRPVF